MSLHRLDVGEDIELKHDFWLHDSDLIYQLVDVLGLKNGEDIVLTNDSHERLYKIIEIKSDEIHLSHLTDLKRKTDPS